jgi:hypothetical protein
MLDAVRCRLLAACSVRALRSWLPLGDLRARTGHPFGSPAHGGGQPHEAALHLLERLQELGGFIAATHVDGQGQVATGRGLGHAQCLRQRPRDAAAEHEGACGSAHHGHRHHGQAREGGAPGIGHLGSGHGGGMFIDQLAGLLQQPRRFTVHAAHRLVAHHRIELRGAELDKGLAVAGPHGFVGTRKLLHQRTRLRHLQPGLQGPRLRLHQLFLLGECAPMAGQGLGVAPPQQGVLPLLDLRLEGGAHHGHVLHLLLGLHHVGLEAMHGFSQAVDAVERCKQHGQQHGAEGKGDLGTQFHGRFREKR